MRKGIHHQGVAVRGVVDHGWCKSIYFRDRNHLQLESCCLTREIDESHRAGRTSAAWTGLARAGTARLSRG